MKEKVFINIAQKQLITDQMAFPLLYGFVSPFAGAPVLAIVKSKVKIARHLPDRCAEFIHTDGQTSGIIFRKAEKIYFEETGDGEDKEYSGYIYLYGLKEDVLIEKAYKELYSGDNIPLENFKKDLLTNDLKGLKAAREISRGNDLLIVSLLEDHLDPA